MSYVLILMVLTGGPNGGNTIAMHKFENKAACERAEDIVKVKFKPRYSDDIQTACVAQS